MLQYPSIPGAAKSPIGKPCIAFYKYDGSNLRWEWQPKKGWCKFGTRTQLFDASTPLYSQTVPIFMDTIADELVYRIKQQEKGIQRIIAFTEFFGPSSFAGSHDENEPKELRLFDVFLLKKGFIKPRQFVKMFSDMQTTANVMYDGNLTKEFIRAVKTGTFELDLFEGIVAKGDDFMVKIKTDKYFERLRNTFKDDITLHDDYEYEADNCFS